MSHSFLTHTKQTWIHGRQNINLGLKNPKIRIHDRNYSQKRGYIYSFSDKTWFFFFTQSASHPKLFKTLQTQPIWKYWGIILYIKEEIQSKLLKSFTNIDNK